MPDTPDIVALTAQIVSAHVSHNEVAPDQLPRLIQQVYETLGGVTKPPAPAAQPAVPINSSVKTDAIICLTCGKPFKMLKRHLMSDHKLTPEQYRQTWNLPVTYPVVAPAYAKTRSALAKKIGLGTYRTTGAAPKKKAGRRRQQ